MDLIRTFLAVPPDDALREQIGRIFRGCVEADISVGAGLACDDRAQGALPRSSTVKGTDARAADGLRWSALAGLHFTLVFLGATRAAQLEALQAAVRGIARGLKAFRYALGGPCPFPVASRPRALVLEPVDPEGFAAWQEPLAAACEMLGFAREARAYRPHLTVARLKRASEVPAVARREPLRGEAREIVLYQSLGGHYQPLFRVGCGEARDR